MSGNKLFKIIKLFTLWLVSFCTILAIFVAIFPSDSEGNVDMPSIGYIAILVLPIIISILFTWNPIKTGFFILILERFGIVNPDSQCYYDTEEKFQQNTDVFQIEQGDRNQEETPKEEVREKPDNRTERMIASKFQSHRKALQAYREKLSKREQELDEREQKLEDGIAAISKKISEDEEVSIKKIDSYTETKMRELRKLETELKKRERVVSEKESELLSGVSLYKRALLETEYRIFDWLNRIDKKEITAFEEIRRNAESFESFEISASESGFQFEEDFAGVLSKNGYESVQVTQKSGDFGADITAEKDGVKFVFQCKKYSSAVGIEAVQQIYAAKMYYSAHVAVVATNSVFTKAAKILADETGVLLWDGSKVKEMIDSAAP